MLRLFTAALESPLGGLLIPSLFQSSGITALRARHFDEAPTFLPLHPASPPAAQAGPAAEWPADSAAPGPGFHFASVADYARAYRAGHVSPEVVAERVLAAITASDAAQPPLRALVAVLREDVLQQA
ncbi:MAG: hypothetical protein KA764_23120, partial [Anaerolineales bacterium]|nr:hypothetical protein [Anaerolineales bacterium]